MSFPQQQPARCGLFHHGLGLATNQPQKDPQELRARSEHLPNLKQVSPASAETGGTWVLPVGRRQAPDMHGRPRCSQGSRAEVPEQHSQQPWVTFLFLTQASRLPGQLLGITCITRHRKEGRRPTRE